MQRRGGAGPYRNPCGTGCAAGILPGLKPTGDDPARVRVIAPDGPPRLTPGAARALLRIWNGPWSTCGRPPSSHIWTSGSPTPSPPPADPTIEQLEAAQIDTSYDLIAERAEQTIAAAHAKLARHRAALVSAAVGGGGLASR
jgi:hypothetical protein